MKGEDFERLIVLLIEASPKSLFLEVAFLESYVSARRKADSRVPVRMIERSLPFLERELRWVPRPIEQRPVARPAWAGVAMGVIMGALAAATAPGVV